MAGELADILEACRRGRDVTQSLLGFAREGSRVEQAYDVGAVVSETVALLRKTTYKGISIEVAQAHELPRVFGDRSLFAQALMNVCLNAVDAMSGRGNMFIRSEEVRADEVAGGNSSAPRRLVRVQVADSGAGMSEEVLAHCMEPFFTTKPRDKGTGLGLSMAYSAAQGHGGSLTIDSKPGEGTSVVFLLETAREDSVESRGVEVGTASTAGATVLLVDDEETIRRVGGQVLEKLGYEVLLAANGKSAIEMFEKHANEIDIVILDLIMPVMDGIEAFDELRKRAPDLKILVSSGYIENAQKVEWLSSKGVSEYLVKPYEIEELRRKLAMMLKS